MSRKLLGLSCALLGAALIATVARQVPAQDKAPDGGKKPAYLTVLLPWPDAILKIDDTPTKQTGKKRTFVTPALEPGKKYSYTLNCFWEPNNYTKITRIRDITIEAGKEATADLTGEADAKLDKVEIRYVPTPEEIVDEMLKLADVKKDDVVYDLGCGDGRIVCTAVSKFGAKRGVGVDIDPERIKDSKVTAKQQKVEDKVEFRMNDVLKIDDYSDANVVMLYMGNDLNLALRPLLRKSLKPGSRIVSHRFLMGDWKPEKTIKIKDAAGEEYLLHLWTIKDEKGKE